MSTSKDEYCLFCYKIFTKGERKIMVRGGNRSDDDCEYSLEEGEDFKRLQTQFFRLLNRHLQQEKVSFEARKIFSDDDVLGQALRQCPDCSMLLQSYCKYFEEIEVLKMKLNWRLWMLVKIVSCSEKVKPRIASFEEGIREIWKSSTKGVGVGDPMESVRGLRKELVRKCSKKLRGGTPIVRLKRCRKQEVQKCEEERKGGREVIGDNNQTESKLESSSAFGKRDEILGATQKILIKTEERAHQVEEIDTLDQAKVKMEINGLIVDSNPDTSPVVVVGPKSSMLQDTITEPESECSAVEDIEVMDTSFEEHWEFPPVDVTNEVKGISAAVEMVTTGNPTNFSSDAESGASVVSNEGSVVTVSGHPLLISPVKTKTKTVSYDHTGATTILAGTMTMNELHLGDQSPCTESTKGFEVDSEGAPGADVEPNERSESEVLMSGTERRFSLRTRHKCSNCSVGFTSAASLKLHMVSCGKGEGEGVSDNQVDEDKHGNDKVEKVDGESDNEKDRMSGSDASYSDSDPEDDDGTGTGLSQTTAAANGSRRNYEFQNTKFNCEVTDCKFYFYITKKILRTIRSFMEISSASSVM